MAHRNLQKPKEKCVFLFCGPCWEAQFRILCSIAYIYGSSFKFSLSFWRRFLKKRSLSLEVTSHKYVELSTFAGYVLNMSWWYRPPAVAHFELHAFFPNLQPCAEIQIENCRAAVCPPQRAFNKLSCKNIRSGWTEGKSMCITHAILASHKTSKPQSPEVSKCFDGNRDAKTIRFVSVRIVHSGTVIWLGRPMECQ